MKKYICPVGCKLDRSEVRRFRINGRQALGCPVHKKHITHVELTCKCGKTVDISIQQAGLKELCSDCQYARKFTKPIKSGKGACRPKRESLRRSECVHYLECLDKIDYRKHNTVMNCWPCIKYEEKVLDPADYMGMGSDRPDFLAPVHARASSTGKR